MPTPVPIPAASQTAPTARRSDSSLAARPFRRCSLAPSRTRTAANCRRTRALVDRRSRAGWPPALFSRATPPWARLCQPQLKTGQRVRSSPRAQPERLTSAHRCSVAGATVTKHAHVRRLRPIWPRALPTPAAIPASRHASHHRRMPAAQAARTEAAPARSPRDEQIDAAEATSAPRRGRNAAAQMLAPLAAAGSARAQVLARTGPGGQASRPAERFRGLRLVRNRCAERSELEPRSMRDKVGGRLQPAEIHVRQSRSSIAGSRAPSRQRRA